MKKNKTVITGILMFCISSSFIFSEAKAKDVMAEAVKKGTADKIIAYAKTQSEQMTVSAEKRAVIIFQAGLQEQMGLYSDAQGSYAKAAGISAGDAEGMPKKSNEQLVLDAVRCALCSGDYITADRYLNSAVRNSKNGNIQAYLKLYEQWSALCKAENSDEILEPVEILKTYTKLPSMKNVHPAVLLTLWYVTGDVSYADSIKKSFPESTEAAIVKGDIQLLPLPFWFFVPKLGIAEQGIGTFTEVTETKTDENVETKKEIVLSQPKFTKWQLGLFKGESNANLLCQELKKKNFDAYVTTEVRKSGTTYYVVLVKEDAEGSVVEKLRSSGYDCYPVE